MEYLVSIAFKVEGSALKPNFARSDGSQDSIGVAACDADFFRSWSSAGDIPGLKPTYRVCHAVAFQCNLSGDQDEDESLVYIHEPLGCRVFEKRDFIVLKKN